MSGAVHDLALVLEAYLPQALSIERAFYLLGTIATLSPILLLHRQQRTERRQPRQTAWLKWAAKFLTNSFRAPAQDGLQDDDENINEEIRRFARDISTDLDQLYELIGLNDTDNPFEALFPHPTLILATPHLTCVICPPNVQRRSLRLQITPQSVQVLCKDFTWRKGTLIVGHCVTCRADHFPDRVTFKDDTNTRIQKLEYGARYLKISKHGLWCDRRIASAQESAVKEFRAGWSNFANHINKHGI